MTCTTVFLNGNVLVTFAEFESKKKVGNPLFIEVSDFKREVPGGFEPP